MCEKSKLHQYFKNNQTWDINSGGFLVAYLLALVIIVYPLLYVQCTLGQYWTQGPLALWRVLPLCYGIGIVTTILSLLEVLVIGNQSGIHFVRIATVLQDTCSRTSGVTTKTM